MARTNLIHTNEEIGKRSYKTVGDVVRALEDIKRDGGSIRGNLRSVLVAISQTGESEEWIDWINNNEIENLLEVFVKYGQDLGINEINKGKQTREGTVDKTKIETLVDEYENYLGKNGGDKDRAWRELEKRHTSEVVRSLRAQLDTAYKESRDGLKNLKLDEGEKEKLAEKVAAEKVKIEEAVKDLGVKREVVKEIVEKGIAEALKKEEGKIIEVKAEEVYEQVKTEILDKIGKNSNDLLDKTPIIEQLSSRVAALTAEVLVEEKISEVSKDLVEKIKTNNQKLENPAETLVPPAVLDGKKGKELEAAIKQAMVNSMVDGEIDSKRWIAEVRDKTGVDLTGFGDTIKKAGRDVQQLVESNQAAITIFTDKALEEKIFSETLALNPDSAELAREYSHLVASVYSPRNNPVNRLDRDEAVAGATPLIEKARKEFEESKKNKTVSNSILEKASVSQTKLNEAYHHLGVITYATRQSPQEWAKTQDDYQRFDSLQKPLKTSSQVRDLDGFMSLARQNPGLSKMLNRAQTVWQRTKRIDGVLTKVIPKQWAGFKQILRLDQGIKIIKTTGTLGRAIGWAESSLVGKTLFRLATEGLTLDMAKSFFLGAAAKGSLKLGLETLSKKLAATVVGKALATLAVNALPVVGQVVSAAMAVSTVLDVGKAIFKKPIDRFLNSLNINIGGDLSQTLNRMGLGTMGDKILFGAMALGGAILGLPLILASATIPWGILGGSFAGLGAMALYQNNLNAALAPPIPIVPGPHGAPGPNGSDEAYPTLDPNITITPGCPSKDIWPLRAPIIVTQGPGGGYSHYYSGHTQAVDFSAPLGTEIVATHNGVVEYGGGPSSAWGYYIDIVGECNGVRYRTRYGHMPSDANGGRIWPNGKPVTQGSVIGIVDTTGRSTGNHLHYELMGSGIMSRINNWLPSPVQE